MNPPQTELQSAIGASHTRGGANVPYLIAPKGNQWR
jgi:hypothetical protein